MLRRFALFMLVVAFAFVASANAERGRLLAAVPNFVVTDTLLGNVQYKIISDVFVSPDARHFAYVAAFIGQVKMVADGHPGRAFSSIDASSPVYSPDSNALAFVARFNVKLFAVLNNAPQQRQYDEIARLMFSPDSTKLAFMARSGNAGLVVVNNVEGTRYEAVGGLVFSADSAHMAYFAKRGAKWFVVLDGVEQATLYESIAGLTFSPDGAHLGFFATQAGKTFVVIDGNNGPLYESAGGLAFSPDSARTAYFALMGGRWFTVLDGVEGTRCDAIGGLTFSPDSAHFAYFARLAGKWFAVNDGVEGARYDAVAGLTFSPDSLHIAYNAVKAGNAFAVVDGAEGKRYAEIGNITLILDPTVKTFSDNVDRATALKGPGVVFSPDSATTAYAARRLNVSTWLIAVNGAETPQYNKWVSRFLVTFDSPTMLHAVIMRSSKVLLAGIKIS